MTNSSFHLLSVVIIGRNEGVRLERCIDSVQAMIAPIPVELIYVDSHSTDGSVELAGYMGASVIELEAGKTTAARARNAGWQQAKGDLILFLDGDTVLHPDFVAKALPLLSLHSICAVFGDRREMLTGDSIYNRVLDLDWIFPYGDSDYFGGDVLVRRSVLAEVNGYDTTLIAGEEPEMCCRIRERGYSILHVALPMTEHDLAMTHFKQYWRRSVRTGFAYACVSRLRRNQVLTLWQNESRHNLRQTGIFVFGAIAATILAWTLHNIWPVALYLLGFLALSIRSAWAHRNKSGNWFTLLLYGFHSHLQQIPIALGQIQFFFKRDQQHSLIEYKHAEGKH